MEDEYIYNHKIYATTNTIQVIRWYDNEELSDYEKQNQNALPFPLFNLDPGISAVTVATSAVSAGSGTDGGDGFVV